MTCNSKHPNVYPVPTTTKVKTRKGRLQFESLVKNRYKIFIDTCSLMHKDAEEVVSSIVAPLLHSHGQKLIVPRSVYNEVLKHQQSDLAEAKKAIKILSKLEKHELYVIESSINTDFADNAIISLFSRLRVKYDLCLITNDNSWAKDGNLSQDILDLKKARSVEYGIKDIKVFYISNKRLHEFSGSKSKRNNRPQPKRVNLEKVFTFKLPTKVKDGNAPLDIKSIPSVSDYVYTGTGEQILLQKQIGRPGGEGIAYHTDTNEICKIYKPGKATIFKEAKIRLLSSSKIKVDGVCLPKQIALNKDGEIVGYIMDMANGLELKTSIFIRPLLESKFPEWDRYDLAVTASNIVKRVSELHRHNIIIGDLNPCNILVEANHHISFIDTDSFQIEGYPCAVGMVPYTRMQNHGKAYDTYLRSFEDDVFAVATLVFQILLPGKLPYSHAGGGSEAQNMSPQNFPYNVYDGEGFGNMPDGQWTYIWMHLPVKLKVLFGDIFKFQKPVSLTRLTSELDSYVYQLSQGYQTRDLFPSSGKHVDKNGHVILEEKDLELTCRICGGSFHLTKGQVEWFETKGFELPKDCEVCRKIKKEHFNDKSEPHYRHENSEPARKARANSIPQKKIETGQYINCNVCGDSFFFTDGEKNFYEFKGLSVPKRCKSCRDSNARPSQPARRGLCFVTTAICTSLGKGDECYELQLLRGFRDNYLLRNGYENLVMDYYETAPDLVTRVNASSCGDQIYERLYEHYLKNIISLIERNQNEEAISLYFDMVIQLREGYHE